MAGSPIKRARREVARQAILNAALDHAILEGHARKVDPVSLLRPVAAALHAKALEGDVPAIREIFDRIDGRVQTADEKDGGGVTVQILNLLTERPVGAEPLAVTLPAQLAAIEGASERFE